LLSYALIAVGAALVAFAALSTDRDIKLACLGAAALAAMTVLVLALRARNREPGGDSGQRSGGPGRPPSGGGSRAIDARAADPGALDEARDGSTTGFMKAMPLLRSDEIEGLSFNRGDKEGEDR
jgi:hypothetical protein